MKKLLLVLLGVTVLVFGFAQDLGGTIRGLYGDGLGNNTTISIPNYGVHAIVNLTTAEFTPEEVRDQALPVFTALASTRGGIVSVSVHASTGFMDPDYVVLFQMIDGTVSVYLNGDPFNP